MKILGFNFTKLEAEKISNNLKDVTVNTNIDVSDIKEVSSDLFDSTENVIGVKFVNTIEYKPNFAKIELKGNVLLSIPQESFEKVIKQWKEKKIPEEFRIPLFNLILKKSTIKALELEEELNIPLHMPMPSIKPGKKE